MAQVQAAEEHASDRQVHEGIVQIIKRRTDELVEQNPDNALTQALQDIAQEKEQELERPFRHVYEDDDIPVNPETMDLDFQVSVVDKEWRAFNEELEEQRQKELEKREKSKWPFKRKIKNKDWSVQGGGYPTTSDIVESVKAVQKTWETKDRLLGGGAQRGFHSFMRNLDQHRTMLKLIPEQSEYFSVLSGGINVIIKASANHQKTAAGLAQALVDITENLESCTKTVQLMNTADMHTSIRNLYIHVFYFLHSVMQWFQSSAWRKVVDSLNEDFYGKFEDQITKIKGMSAMIVQNGLIKTQYEIRDLNLQLQQLAARNFLERKERRMAQEEQIYMQRQQGRMLAQLWEAMGRNAYRTVYSHAHAWVERDEDPKALHSNSMKARMLSIAYDVQGPERKQKVSPKQSTKHEYHAVDVQKWSRHLWSFTTNVEEKLEDLSLDTPTSFTDREVMTSIQDWSSSTVSQSLWILGAPENGYPTAATILAGRVTALASSINIPVLCHLVEMPDEVEDEDDVDAAAKGMVIDLVCTLTRQLVSILPPKLLTAANLDRARWQKITGSFDDLPVALSIFNTLLRFSPPTLLIVIDGLEQFDGTNVAEEVSDILEVLQDAIHDKPKRLLKILYTTAGSCDALEGVDEDDLEVVEAQVRSVTERMRKGVRIEELEFSDEDV